MTIRKSHDKDCGGNVCRECGCREYQKEARTPCSESKTGNHVMVPSDVWVMVASISLYEVTSAKTAMSCFEEACGGNPEIARKLNYQEFDLLRRGKARLEIKVVPL